MLLSIPSEFLQVGNSLQVSGLPKYFRENYSRISFGRSTLPAITLASFQFVCTESLIVEKPSKSAYFFRFLLHLLLSVVEKTMTTSTMERFYDKNRDSNRTFNLNPSVTPPPLLWSFLDQTTTVSTQALKKGVKDF